jgi:hypothetical protein
VTRFACRFAAAVVFGAVGWFYFRTDPLVAKTAGVLLKDEARRMAVNFARLAELLAKPGRGEGDGRA